MVYGHYFVHVISINALQISKVVLSMIWTGLLKFFVVLLNTTRQQRILFVVNAMRSLYVRM